MKLTILDQLLMTLRRAPVKEIKKALSKLETSGYQVRPHELEAHFKAGGHIDKVVAALVLAKENQIDTDFFRITALDIAGKNPVTVVEECTPEHRYSFHSMSPEFFENIQGTTQSGESVFAQCTLVYRKPLNYAWESQLPHIQEVLASEILPIINTAESSMALEINKADYIPSLLFLAQDIMESVISVDVTFQTKRFVGDE